MSGVAGSIIGEAGVQPPIGVYVQTNHLPTANTNYIGLNSGNNWDQNVLGEDITAPWECPTNAAAAAGKDGAWVVAGEAIAEDDKVSIVAGVASVDNSTGTHTCHVVGGVASGQYFWAIEV